MAAWLGFRVTPTQTWAGRLGIVSAMPETRASRVSVVVPTYLRPERLRDALVALGAQRRQVDEIVVVRRSEDAGAAGVLAEHGALPLREVVVEQSGVLAAMIAGARSAQGDLIGFIDDDAAPHVDWLERMLALFDDAGVGGAGGRDIVTEDDALPRVTDVGRITPWGKLIGDHHRAGGPARDVDVLKAANMIFRREALALPRDLLGAGAQVHFEVATCLWARNRGWRLVVDPAAEVDHLPGPRFDADRRGAPSPKAIAHAGHNFISALLTMRPDLLGRRMLYGLLIGDRALPGIGRALIAVALGQWLVARKLAPSIAGQLYGAGRFTLGRRVEMETFGRENARGAALRGSVADSQ